MTQENNPPCITQLPEIFMLKTELYEEKLHIFTHSVTSTMFLFHNYCRSLKLTHISQDNSRRTFNLHCREAQHVPEKKRIEKKGFVIAVGLELKSNMD